MEIRDALSLSLGALLSHRLRTFLSMLGIAVGVAAVILLTSIGEGTRVFIVQQFTQFGTNIMAIFPGKTKTIGIPGAIGGTTRKLTIDDAEAVSRVPGILFVMPLSIGQARVEANARGRSVYVYGVTADLPRLWKFGVRQGRFLTSRDPRWATHEAVLGPKLKRELFGEENPLGEYVRIGARRFRIVGVMEPKGQMLGFDVDDAAYIAVASALQTFNLDEVMEIDVSFGHESMTADVEAGIRRVLTQRHRGEDFTVVTQTAMLDVFGRVMNAITVSVGAIAGISLLVGAIGILTMMWITVGERTAEIGLLVALGSTRRQILVLFLLEAIGLAFLGGGMGVGAGFGGAVLLKLLVPGLPVETPLSYVAAALSISITTGLLAGILPARRAADLDPVVALRAE